MTSFYVTEKVKKKKKSSFREGSWLIRPPLLYLVMIRIKEVPAIPANLEAAGGVHLARRGRKAAAAGMQKTDRT